MERARPAAPDLPGSLSQCRSVSLADGLPYERIGFDGTDLSNQVAHGCALDQVRFSNVSLAATRLDGAKLTDVVFERCDLAAAVWNEVSFLRVRFVGCRLSAFALNRGSLVDLEVIGCRGDCPSVFESEGRRWLIEESELAELDCRGLRLTDGSFDRCQLPKSQWGRAKLDRVAFVHSDLSAVGGVAGLGRGTVDTATLLTLAPALARHAGVTVTDDD